MEKIIKKLLTALSLFFITSLYIPSAFSIINSSVLKHAHKIFYNTPGFITVLKKTMACKYHPSGKGHAYEIQTAMHINKSSNTEKILEFGYKIKCPQKKIRREFDIRTDKHFIECKYINWKKANVKKLKKQLRNQRYLTKLYNKINGTSMLYVVYSNNPIPKKWQQWLNNENIAFEETGSDD